MSGMNATTGRRIDDLAHLRQSIADILDTPIGSRVMRREYGSGLFELLDQPDSPSQRLRIYAATADALARWEPRLSLTHVRAGANDDGRLELDLEGAYRPGGQATSEMIRLESVRV